MAQYRIPVEETFSWQRPVKDILNDPPGGPAKGDRYIVGVGTGAWSGKDNDITWYDGADWKFDVPAEGWQCWVQDVNEYYCYNGSAWILSDLDAKADKVVGAMAGDFASLDSSGNLEDSGKSPSDFEDAGAVATHEANYDHTKIHTQNTDTGTTSQTFQLQSGSEGAKLKNNAGVVESRNAADDAYANIKGNDLVAAGNVTDGTNATSPAGIKEAYDRRGSYDAGLGCILMTIA